MKRIGIDLGGTNIQAGLCDENYELLDVISVPTDSSRGAGPVVEDMIALCETLMEKNGLEEKDIEQIGIGAPGLIDSKNGIVVYSNNLDWENTDLKSAFAARLNIPLAVANDADAAAIGEVKAGAARGMDNAILLTLGTGVGGGIVLEGKVFSGFHPGGAELGHTTLIHGGRECTCGRKGCLEAYASATGLIRTMKENLEEAGRSAPEGLDGKMIFSLAAQKDPQALETVDSYTTWLAEGIANYVNIFRPQAVLLGGGISHAGSALLDLLNEKLPDLCFGKERSVVPVIRQAQLGNDAGIIGAAAL